jgi:hypothetical protein
MMDRMKPLTTSPELLEKLYACRYVWERMTDSEREEMIRLQTESWLRQDME